MTKQDMVNDMFEHIGQDRLVYAIITDGEDIWGQLMGDHSWIDINDHDSREIGRIPLEYAHWDDTLAEWNVEDVDDMDDETAEVFKVDVVEPEIDRILELA